MTPAGWGELARMSSGSNDFALKIIQRLVGYRQNSLQRAADSDNLGMALDAWWNRSRAEHDEHVLVVPSNWSDEKLEEFLQKWPKSGGKIIFVKEGEK